MERGGAWYCGTGWKGAGLAWENACWCVQRRRESGKTVPGLDLTRVVLLTTWNYRREKQKQLSVFEIDHSAGGKHKRYIIHFTNSVPLNVVNQNIVFQLSMHSIISQLSMHSMLSIKILFLNCPCSSPSLAVKEYIRAGAGQQVPDLQDLRPPPVLMETINHLMKV